jgi:hypothetical protein
VGKVLKLVVLAVIAVAAVRYFSDDRSSRVMPGVEIRDVRHSRESQRETSVFRNSIVVESPNVQVRAIPPIEPFVTYAAAENIQVHTFYKQGMMAGILVTGIALFVFSLAALWKLMFGGGGGRRGNWDASETQTLQELHAGFARMESRVESLETILLERASSASVR